MKCKECENLKKVSIGMDIKGREKFGYLCSKQPLAGEGAINQAINEKYGYDKIYKNHIDKCSPKWCPLKNK